MTNRMNNEVKAFILDRLNGFADSFIYTYDIEHYNESARIIKELKDKTENESVPNILYNLMTDKYELCHDDMADGSGEDLMFEGYNETDLWGREPDCYYNFISVYSDLSNDTEIKNEMSKYLNEYGEPEDIYNFADGYAAMKGNENFDSWEDLNSVFISAIKQYLNNNYEKILANVDDTIKEIVDSAKDRKEFKEISKDAFDNEDWGF